MCNICVIDISLPPVPSAPLNLTVTCTGPTSINITWSAPASVNGILLKYNAYAYSDDEFLQEKHEVTADPEITYNSVSFANLLINTVYLIEVSAGTRIGEGPRTALYVTMDHGYFLISPPSFVETVKSTAIKLSWGYPERTLRFIQVLNTTVTGYIIYHNVTSKGQLNVNLSLVNKTGSQSHIFQGLMPFTYYGFSVSVHGEGHLDETFNFIICSRPSEIVVARTDEDCKLSHSE